MKNKCFKLFACCIPVKGASRSIICDLQRGSFEYIPNILYDIVIDVPNLTLNEIKEKFEFKFNDIIDSYFEFLIEHELGFWCNKNEISDFPEIEKTWESPSTITNAIIDFDKKSKHNVEKVCRELDILGCKALELRFYDEIEIDNLSDILGCFQKSRLRSISLIMKYDTKINKQDWERLCCDNQRVKQVVFHSSNSNRVIDLQKTYTKLTFQTNTFDSELCCGVINSKYFSVNIDLFTEAQSFNTCLNRKISIDKHSNIKNCPSSKIAFGNINETSLIGIAKNIEFQRLWLINKEEINVCKKCEFRFICTDCRVYLQDTEDIYSKPLKCGYNPDSCEWEEWSLNPLKQKSMDIYKTLHNT